MSDLGLKDSGSAKEVHLTQWIAAALCQVTIPSDTGLALNYAVLSCSTHYPRALGVSLPTPFKHIPLILAQVLAAVKNSDAQIAKWAKSAGYCGEVELSAVLSTGANPTAAQTYACSSQKGTPVKQLCCDRSLV